MRISNHLHFTVLSVLSLITAYTVFGNSAATPRVKKLPQVSKVAGCHYWDRDLTNVTRWVVYSAPQCAGPGTAAPGGATTTLSANALRSDVVDSTSTPDNTDDSNKFQIIFQCKVVSPEICRKAEAGFRQAASIISSAFDFTVPVVVDAIFRSYGPDQSKTLGSASTTRFHLLTDDDGVDRLYPQSLVKQLKLSTPEGMAPKDIYAEFNADANFWFAGGAGIQPKQHDFTYVVLHELFHGLGFASSWRDYFNINILTPLPQTSAPGGTFSGFQQFAFDKYIIETARGISLGEAAKTIIAAGLATPDLQNVSMTPGPSSPFAQALQASAIIPESKRVLALASTANSMKFQSNQGTQIELFLETSLSPYRQGSSVSHAASQTTSNTPDFLMRFSLEPGITLSQIVRKVAKGNSFGPIGPNLAGVMATLGYSVRQAPGRGITDFLAAAAAAESAGSSALTSSISTKLFRASVPIAVAVLCSGLFTH